MHARLVAMRSNGIPSTTQFLGGRFGYLLLFFEPEVLQSGFGVNFLFWPSEF